MANAVNENWTGYSLWNTFLLNWVNIKPEKQLRSGKVLWAAWLFQTVLCSSFKQLSSAVLATFVGNRKQGLKRLWIPLNPHFLLYLQIITNSFKSSWKSVNHEQDKNCNRFCFVVQFIPIFHESLFMKAHTRPEILLIFKVLLVLLFPVAAAIPDPCCFFSLTLRDDCGSSLPMNMMPTLVLFVL